MIFCHEHHALNVMNNLRLCIIGMIDGLECKTLNDIYKSGMLLTRTNLGRELRALVLGYRP